MRGTFAAKRVSPLRQLNTEVQDMKIKFIARKFNITDDVKERFQKKLSKLDKFFPAETEAVVSLYE